MNKQRRTKVRKIIEMLEKQKNELSIIGENLDEVSEEESDARENMPESMMYTDRYELSEEISDKLDEASASITDIIEIIDDILAVLDEI